MKKKTFIFTLKELYQNIPNLKVLEGEKFNDINQFIKTVIPLIDENKNWEFVQFIHNTNPTIFIVRQIYSDSQYTEEIDCNVTPINSCIQNKAENINRLTSELKSFELPKTSEKLPWQ